MCTYYKEIRSILEYSCVVFHYGLTQEQSQTIESVQRLVLKLLSRYLKLKFSYMEACIFFCCESLLTRRVDQCETYIRRSLKTESQRDLFMRRKTARMMPGMRPFQEYRSKSSKHFNSPLVALIRRANQIKI